MKKILLKGYYGAGNLGDDLLMISSYHILKRIFPDYKIYIQAKDNYVLNLVPDVHLVDSQEGNFDIGVFGGGGLFFDFSKPKLKYQIFNTFYKVFGSKFLYNFYPNLQMDKPYPIIFGYGIGFGPYNYGSPNFYRHMELAKKFDFLSVRDKMSYQIVKKFNPEVKKHTDIAFLPKLEKEYFIPYRNNQQQKNFAIIIRDWIYGNNYLNELFLMSEKWKKEGYNIRFVSLNPENDKKSIKEIIRKNYSLLVYQKGKIKDFLKALSESSLIISERAHGAIIAALLHIPSITLGLEPKLKNVHKMLPNSTKYVSFKKIRKDQYLKFKVSNDHFKKDIFSNQKKVDLLIDDLRKFKYETFD